MLRRPQRELKCINYKKKKKKCPDLPGFESGTPAYVRTFYEKKKKLIDFY